MFSSFSKTNKDFFLPQIHIFCWWRVSLLRWKLKLWQFGSFDAFDPKTPVSVSTVFVKKYFFWLNCSNAFVFCFIEKKRSKFFYCDRVKIQCLPELLWEWEFCLKIPGTQNKWSFNLNCYKCYSSLLSSGTIWKTPGTIF